jgi:hypothetical protein
MVEAPVTKIWHDYQDKCNKEYYEYFREGDRGYNLCDDYLAANFPPLHIIDKANEGKILDLNKQYKTRWEAELRSRLFREDSRALAEFLAILDER